MTSTVIQRNGTRLELHRCDCMDLMRDLPDKAFDLAIVDPPYGIGEDGASNHSRGKLAVSQCFTPKNWDSNPPAWDYFNELFRVSKNQIIWGGNYFVDHLTSSPCWIVWDKLNGETDFADCELAWTSFKSAVRKFQFRWQGMLQGNMKAKEHRIHPTQKPVALYSWLLANYAKPGQTILDTHGGSMSSVLACARAGFSITCCELDADYFKAGVERVERELAQMTFDLKPEPEPSTPVPDLFGIQPARM